MGLDVGGRRVDVEGRGALLRDDEQCVLAGLSEGGARPDEGQREGGQRESGEARSG